MDDTHGAILSGPTNVQGQSPLFALLPGEVRHQIFLLALTDYEDTNPEHQFDQETCYTRPSYFAPRKTDTELLRTCRAVYKECWHMPFILTEQIHWLTASNRAPPGFKSSRLHRWIHDVAELKTEEDREIDLLRVFAQMYVLEDGALARLLATPLLRPRTLILTIRHADWWFWEEDEPLRFESKWIEAVSRRLPDSVREIRIELESLKRKKKQVDEIATQMTEKWYFKRSDDVVLFADTSSGAAQINEWSGTSTWHSQRWIRDESSPGKIDYYVRIVSFRARNVIERRGGVISEKAGRWAAGNFYGQGMKLGVKDASRIIDYQPWIEAGPDLGPDQPSVEVDPDLEYEELDLEGLWDEYVEEEDEEIGPTE